MIFGAITNSWRQQLADHDLAGLVGEAKARGAKHVELRQTCLGACETGQGEEWRPVVASLGAVVDQFPGLSFDLAMAWPCLTEKAEPSGELFQAALEAARVVGRETPICAWWTPAPLTRLGSRLRICPPRRYRWPI